MIRIYGDGISARMDEVSICQQWTTSQQLLTLTLGEVDIENVLAWLQSLDA
jgi:hypothetical protein